MTGPFPFPTRYLDEVVAPSAVHPTEFYSLTDPALDADNHVDAGKRWRKTDDLATPTWFEVYIRNTTNSDWILERAWKNEAFAVGEVPIADANGRLAPGTVSGGSTVDVEDEGSPEGAADTIDFTGAGVSVSFAAGTATVNIPGGGGAHASDHENGGGDEIDVGGLSGELADPQKVQVSAEGTPVASRPEINFVEGSNITITVTDDGGGNKVDVEIAASGGGSVPDWVDDLWSGHPDAYPVSPNTEDDEFAAGSLDAKWTNVSGATVAFASSRMTVDMVNAAAAEFRQAYAPGAGAAFTITAKFTGITHIEATDYIGIMVQDSGNAFIADADYRFDATGTRWNKDNPGGNGVVTMQNKPDTVYLRISRDSSNNYTWGYSWDGLVYSYPHTPASSSTTVAKIGFRIGQTQSRSYKKTSIDWFRRT